MLTNHDNKNCYNYLVRNLERFGATVVTQNDIVERYDGFKMQMKNIIGSFNENSYKRIFLILTVSAGTKHEGEESVTVLVWGRGKGGRRRGGDAGEEQTIFLDD